MDPPSPLAIRVVIGDGGLYERFRIAYEMSRPRVGTLREVAIRLRVHPSTLAQSNFRLPVTCVPVAAALFKVPAAFLGPAPSIPGDLPDPLRPVHALVSDIRSACIRGSPAQAAGFWSDDAAVLGVDPAELASLVPHVPALVVQMVHQVMAAVAERQLDRTFSVGLTQREIVQIIDVLVASSLAESPDNLRHPPVRLARRLHQIIVANGRPP